MNLQSATAAKAGKLIRLLASDRDGEVLSATRALARTLRAAGPDFHALAEVVETKNEAQEKGKASPSQPASSWRRAARFCSDHPACLSLREHKFILDMLHLRREPSTAQQKWLTAIYERIWRERSR